MSGRSGSCCSYRSSASSGRSACGTSPKRRRRPSTGCEHVMTGADRTNFVFFMPHGGAIRNFWSVLELLSERGHTVHLAVERQKAGMVGVTLLVEQAGKLHGVSIGEAPRRARPRIATLGSRLRLIGD